MAQATTDKYIMEEETQELMMGNVPTKRRSALCLLEGYLDGMQAAQLPVLRRVHFPDGEPSPTDEATRSHIHRQDHVLERLKVKVRTEYAIVVQSDSTKVSVQELRRSADLLRKVGILMERMPEESQAAASVLRQRLDELAAIIRELDSSLWIPTLDELNACAEAGDQADLQIRKPIPGEPQTQVDVDTALVAKNDA